jgi:peptidoglycan/xylan/chitin deacetylase (PgdA/CDA1 family)
MTSPSAVSRGEFSGRVAVPRVLDVLRREGVSATFFVPGITI